MRSATTLVLAAISLMLSSSLAAECKGKKDGKNYWNWKTSQVKALGIHRFTGEDAMDYCEKWAETTEEYGRPKHRSYWVPHHGFDLTCDMVPEDLTIPARILGEDPPCVSMSNNTLNDGDKTLSPVVKFCNLDVCSDLTIVGARKRCHEMVPRCFGVCDDGEENMPLDYTSGYYIWRAPAGYMHIFMNGTRSSLGRESAVTTRHKCFGKDIFDGKIPEDKTPVEGSTWVQSIKDRLPIGVYWAERASETVLPPPPAFEEF